MDPFDLRLWHGFKQAGGDLSLPATTDQITIDSRRIHSGNSLFVALEGNHFDGHRFIPSAIHAGARFILAKKGWSSQESLGNTTILYVENPLIAFQEIAGAYRKQLPCRIIAIAGSYGKTMVKDLLQTMLQKQFCVAASPESFNSQIGVPLSLLTIKQEHQIALIEAGFSQKEEAHRLGTIIQSTHGIITHIGEKHLTTLGDLQTVASEMLNIFDSNLQQQWTILPNDPYLVSHFNRFRSPIHLWTDHSPHLPHAAFTSAERGANMSYRVDFPDGKCHVGQISSGFYYFLDLINITSKAAWLLGICSAMISESLRHYTPEPTRTEIWKSPLGTIFINDTYCSDPQSVDRALKYFDQIDGKRRRVFLFGGMKGEKGHDMQDYARIGKTIRQANISQFLLFGTSNFQPLIDEASFKNPNMEISSYRSLQETLNAAKSLIQPNDVVLIKGDHKYALDTLTETFHDSICSNQCIINLAAITENLQKIRQKVPPYTRCMVMVKALAYGTDDVQMAKFLATCGIDILGVSYVDEGVALKRAGVCQDIFVINAAIYEANKVAAWNLEIGVSDQKLIEAIANAAQKEKRKIKVHLHVDTGMSRFGCRPEEAIPLARSIQTYPWLELAGIMTHFACADDPQQDEFTHGQAACFDGIIADLEKEGINPLWRHAANSSGTIRFRFPQYNMIRIGLAVYGLYSSRATKEALELRLALSLLSRIVGINVCKQGESISYGRSYKVQRNQECFAVLPIGYFDGLHRNYSGKSAVIVRGQKAPMVGNICMDFMMIDVTDILGVSPGDSVLIFGEDEHGHYLSPEELASKGDSIVHELITCLGPRIQRIFVYEETKKIHS